MILQALVQHYQDLAAHGEIASPGWSCTFINFEVRIDLCGNLTAIVPIVNEDKKGRPEFVPLQLKRSGTNPPPYFLCDGAMYVLGIENYEVTEKSRKYFAAFASFNIELLSKMPCDEATAIIHFLQNWDLDKALSNPIIQGAVQNGLGRGNLTFRVCNNLAVSVPTISEGWNTHYSIMLQSGISGTCLVTGKIDTIARIHNSVKGIYSKSLAPNGWTLVSFDRGSPAYNSYGKEQGYNAPIGEYAAFAYTSALNHLLSDQEHVYHVGDTTVVCWA